MMLRLALIASCFALVIGSAAAQSRTPEPKRSASPQLVSVGEVAKIDLKKRTFELRTVMDGEPRETPPIWPADISVGIGTTALGGAANPNSPNAPNRTGPNARLGPPFPPDDPWEKDDKPPFKRPNYSQTKIHITDKTVIKHDDGIIALDQLKVGDQVTVKGFPKGKNFEASEILRKMHK